jgi:uncharacterized protein YhhL (DUF1145 family)
MRPNTVVFDLDVDKVTAQDRNWDHDGIPNFVQVSETGRIPSRPRTPQAPVWILVARGVTIALTVLTLIALALSIKEEERLGYPSVPGSSSCLPPLIAVRIPAQTWSMCGDRRLIRRSQVSIILTWSLIAFALAKPFNVRLHLAFYIVCDLIAWLALLSFGIFASIVAAFNEETKGWKCTSRFRPQVPNCEARSERLESVKLGAGCLTCILA